MGTLFLWAWNKVSGSEGKSNCSGKSKGLIKTFKWIWFRVQNRGKGQATYRVCYFSDVSDPGSFGRHGDVAYIGSSEGL